MTIRKPPRNLRGLDLDLFLGGAVFTKILIPIDLTEKNTPALEVGQKLVEVFGGSITVVHVIELLDAPMDELEDFYGELEENSRAKMERLTKPLRDAGIPVDHHIRYGKRVGEIIAFADEMDADLVIVSSHRIDPQDPARTWMTISHQLVMLVTKPVLMVK